MNAVRVARCLRLILMLVTIKHKNNRTFDNVLTLLLLLLSSSLLLL